MSLILFQLIETNTSDHMLREESRAALEFVGRKTAVALAAWPS